MNIIDWFDVNNFEHILGYDYLIRTGHWPVGFIPEGTEFVPNWNILIMSKLADAYINVKKLKEI